MRDLLNALKVLDKYGLLPEKRGRGKLTAEGIIEELSKPSKRRPVTEPEVARAVAMWNDDVAIVEIARKLNRAQSTVRRMLGL